MSLSMKELVAMIPEWLAITHGRDVAVGLPREEALRRAAVLRGLLRDGKVKPDEVVLDEGLKDVLYALVALVTEIDPRGGEALVEEANGVYQFLARVEWPDDDFGEKKDLTVKLAAAGWGALGTSLEEVERFRQNEPSAGRSKANIHGRTTDPRTLDPRTLHLASMIPDWLAVTAGREVSVGLSREDALRRACVLRGLLRGGTLDPACVVLDEDLKAVFHGLVALVTDIDRKAGRHLAAEASAVYHFIRRVEWGCDDLGERGELLRSCAEVGWRALGLSLRDVCMTRNRLEDGTLPPAEGDIVSPKYRRAVLRTLASLQHERNSNPATAASNSVRVHERLAGYSGASGFLDERCYVQGSAALSAAVPLRLLGKFDEATIWLDRAEQCFRACLDPTPLLSVVGYARLSILFEREQFDRTLEFLPVVRKGLHEAGMRRFSLKCDFLWAVCLKNFGRQVEARKILERMRSDEELGCDAGLRGLVLVHLADLLQSEGRFDGAAELLTSALSLVETSTYSFAKSDLLLVLGDSLRRQGRHEEAMSAFVEGTRQYGALGMVKWVAYGRLLMAETLLALSRPREAEVEILLALPTIEELRLVPNGFAAMALLRESLRRQKMNPEALRQLREHLQRQR